MRAGVVGLGDMGSGLAKNLIANGFEVTGLDLSSERMEAFEALGGTPATSVAEVGANAIIVNVPPCAPGNPPDTGVSIIDTPVPFRASPISIASIGLIVAVRMTMPPSAICAANPSSPKITPLA